MVEMVMFNVQRIITPKVGKPESQFMCSAHCLKMFYISVKFCENISNSVRVMEQRQNYKALTLTLNFRRYNNSSPLFVAGHKNTCKMSSANTYVWQVRC